MARFQPQTKASTLDEQECLQKFVVQNALQGTKTLAKLSPGGLGAGGQVVTGSQVSPLRILSASAGPHEPRK